MELKVTFLDCISHGDCTVITFKENNKDACIVIDGGETKASAAALTKYLKQQNVKTIDLMVGTHIDSDHINGLKHFVKAELEKKSANKPHIKIKEFWGPMPSEENISDIAHTSLSEADEPGDTASMHNYIIQSVRQNDDLFDALREFKVKIQHPSLDNPPKVRFKNVDIELLGPDTQIPADQIKRAALGLTTRGSEGLIITSLEQLEAAIDKNTEMLSVEAKRNANNQSIVLRLKPASGASAAMSWSFLFTGDAEEEAWDEMVTNSKTAQLLPARVLKIPHHGSALNGITKEGARKVKPKYSVNLVGQKHGLPDEGPLKLLQEQKSKILCTQRNNSEKHKSACYQVPAGDCPASENPQTISFILNTNSGICKITPENRACRYDWQN
jgi:beta-lactamase superfamily II metal-dependent hydrolase